MSNELGCTSGEEGGELQLVLDRANRDRESGGMSEGDRERREVLMGLIRMRLGAGTKIDRGREGEGRREIGDEFGTELQVGMRDRLQQFLVESRSRSRSRTLKATWLRVGMGNEEEDER